MATGISNSITTTVNIDVNQARQDIVKLNSTASNSTKTLEERIIAKNKAIELQNALSKKAIDLLTIERRTLEGQGASAEKLNAIFEKTNKVKLDAAKLSESSTVALDRLKEAQNGQTSAKIQERVATELNNKTLKQEALERLGLVSAYSKLTTARDVSKNKLRDLIASETASTAEIKKAQKEFLELEKKVRGADSAVNSISKSAKGFSLSNISGGVKDLIGAFGLTLGITAFVAGLKDAFKTINQFEQSIANLSAITGASGKDLAFLRNSAIEMGQGVKGGAKEVAEAYALIASAKPELLENVQALNQVTAAVITLSQASGLELPNAAKSLSDALNQFGAGADEASKFVDVLAAAAKFGAAEIPSLTEAILRFGAVAKSTNVSIQESAALVELLAENGLKGARAGTALRNILLKISAPDALPRRAREAIDQLGISMETLKDKTIPVQEKLEALKPLLKDNANVVKVFGLENSVAALNILSHTERLADLTEKVDQNGIALEQAALRTDTIIGKTDKLGATYDSLILSLDNGTGPVSEFFKLYISGADSALKSLIKLLSSQTQLLESAQTKGALSGAAAFSQKLNDLAGSKLSPKARESIGTRIREIDDLLKKGVKGLDTKSLAKERDALLNKFGTGSVSEVTNTITKEAAANALKLSKEIKKINAEIAAPFASGENKGLFYRDELKQRQLVLAQALAKENAIVTAGNAKNKEARDAALSESLAKLDEGGGGNESSKQKAAREKAEAKAQKDADDNNKRRLKNELDLLENAKNAKKQADTLTLEDELIFLDKKNAIDIQQTGLNALELLDIEQDKQLEIAKITQFYQEKDKAAKDKKIEDQFKLDALEIESKRAHGENVLELELGLLERKRIQELDNKKLTDVEIAAVTLESKLKADEIIANDAKIKLEETLALDQAELERKKLNLEDTYALEKQIRDQNRAIELSDASLSGAAISEINQRFQTLDSEAKKVAIAQDLNQAAEAFGLQKELKVATALMNLPDAISNSFTRASAVYAPPLSLAMGALGAAAVTVPIIKGISDIKKARFSRKGKTSSGSGGSGGSSASAGVSTASVGNIAANNIARLGVDPSIASGATATAASRIAGSVSNNVVFSESRYNDFQNQIKFKENKSSF
jgi:TP901 family phage tail tape measure protein